jgi:hypothetical protein
MKNKIIDYALLGTVIVLWIMVAVILIVLLNDMLRMPS